MCVLKIQLFGTVQVTNDGLEAALAYDKVRALLAYLVVEKARAHPRLELAALLWPDHAPRRARQNLSQAQYTLRHALATIAPSGTFILSDTQTIQWNCDAPYAADVDALCRLRAVGDRAEIDDIRNAVEVYRGEFLQGLMLSQADAFNAWLMLQRETYHRLAVAALRRLSAWHEESREYATALEYAQRRVDLDRWQEEAHRQVMRLLDAQGRSEEALVQYELCRTLLADELDVEPSAATQHLVKQIQSRRRTARPVRPLPAMLTPLFGRTSELDRITTLLTAGDCRLVSLVGPGGSGKTHLALAAAHGMADVFSHGVIFVALSGHQSASDILPAIADELGLQPTRHEDVATQLYDTLQERTLLVVLDNLEHLLDGVPCLTELLRRVAGLKLLTTSRAVLHAAGEHVVHVGGLATASDANVDDVPATALFLYHLHRRLDFMPDAHELAAIDRICRRVDGMPLAILLAAALSPAVPLEELDRMLAAEDATEMPQALDLLAADWPDLPLRQRSMRAVMAHAWRQLPAAEQAAFAALSIFRESFALPAAQAVARVDLLGLRRLVDHSLLTRRDDGRFAIHELLRQFAAEQLAAQPQVRDAVHARQRAYFAAFVNQHGGALRGPQQRQAVRALSADLDNILLAWRTAVAARDAALIATMLDGLCSFFDWRSRYTDGIDLCSDAYRNLCDPVLRARLAIWRAHFRHIAGQVDIARAELRTWLAKLVADPDDAAATAVRASGLHELGVTYMEEDSATARALLVESLRLYHSLHLRWEEASVRLHLAQLHVTSATYDAGLAEADTVIHLAQILGDQRLHAEAQRVKSACFGMQGQLEAAETAARASIEILTSLDDQANVAASLMELAAKFVYAGEFAAAIELWDEMETIAQALGAARLQVTADHFRGWAYTNLGQYALAEEYYLNAERLCAGLGDRHIHGLGSLGRGEIRLALGDYHSAYTMLKDAEANLDAVGQADELAITRCELVLALRGLQRHAEAWDLLGEILRQMRPTNAFPPFQNVINACALLLSDAGEIARAVELHTLVCQHPYIGRSVYRDHVIGRTIDAAAATLVDDVRRAAETRGRARDLFATVTELAAGWNRSRQFPGSGYQRADLDRFGSHTGSNDLRH